MLKWAYLGWSCWSDSNSVSKIAEHLLRMTHSAKFMKITDKQFIIFIKLLICHKRLASESDLNLECALIVEHKSSKKCKKWPLLNFTNHYYWWNIGLLWVRPRNKTAIILSEVPNLTEKKKKSSNQHDCWFAFFDMKDVNHKKVFHEQDSEWAIFYDVLRQFQEQVYVSWRKSWKLGQPNTGVATWLYTSSFTIHSELVFNCCEHDCHFNPSYCWLVFLFSKMKMSSRR